MLARFSLWGHASDFSSRERREERETSNRRRGFRCGPDKKPLPGAEHTHAAADSNGTLSHAAPDRSFSKVYQKSASSEHSLHLFDFIAPGARRMEEAAICHENENSKRKEEE